MTVVEDAPRARPRSDSTVLISCGLVWSAGLIHLQAAADHFDEYVPYAVCFIALALVQFVWGAAACKSASRRLLLAGIALNLGVVIAWVLSRTAGLPFGPDARAPETVGLLDTIATLDEVLFCVLVAAMIWLRADLSRRLGRLRPLLLALRTVALTSILTSCLVLGGGLHAH